MEDNIFARIGRGDVPVEIIYEDEFVIAFRAVSYTHLTLPTKRIV